MTNETWDWGVGSREIADLSALREGQIVREVAPSPDGERIAAVVQKQGGGFGIVVNGKPWETEPEIEKAWHLTFGPGGQLAALVRLDDEWTVAIEGVPWQERFTSAWNTKWSEDGTALAVQVKRGAEYTLAIDGKAWEQGFPSCREYDLSPDGKHAAAAVQVRAIPEAGIFEFLEGTWSVAVDGRTWDHRFINVYSPVVSPDGHHVAAEVRLGICEYTVAEDGVPWEARFTCVWEHAYRTAGPKLLGPVRTAGAWTLAENGTRLWRGSYVQLWHVRQSPQGTGRVAAVVAPALGKWTIAVDDRPWPCTFTDLVCAPVFSPRGDRVGAAVRDDGAWSIAVDGRAWGQRFDMAWDPVFDASGENVVARVGIGGRATLATARGTWAQRFETLWDPVFSADGKHVLVRGIAGGRYVRRVVPFSSIDG